MDMCIFDVIIVLFIRRGDRVQITVDISSVVIKV